MRQHTAPLRVADSADGERKAERLRDLIGANLDALEAILHWNHAHGIEVFRLTSNLIPFGSHPANELAWWEEFQPRFAQLGAFVRASGMRL